MIGKSLNDRYAQPPFTNDRAVLLLTDVLRSHAPQLVNVRVQGPEMVVVVAIGEGRGSDANALLRELGFELKKGAVGILGLAGADLARVLGRLTDEQRTWLLTPSTSRETKVVLAATGLALLSIETADGKAAVTCHAILADATPSDHAPPLK